MCTIVNPNITFYVSLGNYGFLFTEFGLHVQPDNSSYQLKAVCPHCTFCIKTCRNYTHNSFQNSMIIQGVYNSLYLFKTDKGEAFKHLERKDQSSLPQFYFIFLDDAKKWCVCCDSTSVIISKCM